MPELTLADLQREFVDLKIRVNNLEKKLSRIQVELKEKQKGSYAHKYINVNYSRK